MISPTKMNKFIKHATSALTLALLSQQTALAHGCIRPDEINQIDIEIADNGYAAAANSIFIGNVRDAHAIRNPILCSLFRIRCEDDFIFEVEVTEYLLGNGEDILKIRGVHLYESYEDYLYAAQFYLEGYDGVGDDVYRDPFFGWSAVEFMELESSALPVCRYLPILHPGGDFIFVETDPRIGRFADPILTGSTGWLSYLRREISEQTENQ